MVRVVVDTNVLVSALVGHGKPKSLLLRLFETHSLVLSNKMLAELMDVLSREKFNEVKPSKVGRFLSLLAGGSKLVNPSSISRVVPEDPDDDLVLATAEAGDADYIVTGDRHLLSLKEFRGTRIVEVSEMLALLG